MLAAGGTPDIIDWVLRIFAYAAIAVPAGIAVIALFVWPEALAEDRIQRALASGGAATSVLGFLQLLVLSGDLHGTSLLGGLSHVADGIDTDPGKALMIRIALGVVLSVLAVLGSLEPTMRIQAIAAVTVLAIATWAYTGKGAYGRWSLLGIIDTVGHHAAGAAWIGSLGVMSVLALPLLERQQVGGVLRRFSPIAALCVAVVVITGVVEAIRLNGTSVFGTHGRWLILKVALLALALWLSAVGRRKSMVMTESGSRRRSVSQLRSAMRTELAVGAVILGISSILVATAPGSADSSVSVTPGLPSSSTKAGSDGSTPDDGSGTPISTPGSAVATSPRTAARTTTKAPASCRITTQLKRGSSGNQVTCLQKTLVAKKLLTATPNGSFGPATEKAVKAFQKSAGLSTDGIVGKQTATKLGIWGG